MLVTLQGSQKLCLHKENEFIGKVRGSQNYCDTIIVLQAIVCRGNKHKYQKIGEETKHTFLKTVVILKSLLCEPFFV